MYIYMKYLIYFQDQQQKQISVIDKVTRETLKLIRRERETMETNSNSR